MGGTISQTLGFNRYRVLLIGMENCGKTTLLYNLKLGAGNAKIVEMPTSVNMERVDFQGKVLDIWEIGGGSRVRPLWSHYYPKMDFVIFLIDSTDREGFEDAKLQLWRVLEDVELEKSKFLVFANKIDNPNGMNIQEIEEKLESKTERFENKKIKLFKCCASTQEGVEDGLSWLIS